MGQKTLLSWMGNKHNLSDWIQSNYPDHQTYVEPFGGSGSMFLHKPRSKCEVYNDEYKLLVDLFQEVKNNTEELHSELKTIPYSRELYQEYHKQLINNELDGDSIERVAKFLFVNTATFAANMNTIGFKSAKHRNIARTWELKKDMVLDVAERYRGIILENRDYEPVMHKYDSEDTLFYLDPPYSRGQKYYDQDNFDHKRFKEVILEMDGYCLISYGNEIPFELPDELNIIDSKQVQQNSNQSEESEKLIANYKPSEVNIWSGINKNLNTEWSEIDK